MMKSISLYLDELCPECKRKEEKIMNETKKQHPYDTEFTYEANLCDECKERIRKKMSKFSYFNQFNIETKGTTL